MNVWCEHCRDHFDTDHYVNDAHGVGPGFGPYGELLRKAALHLEITVDGWGACTACLVGADRRLFVTRFYTTMPGTKMLTAAQEWAEQYEAMTGTPARYVWPEWCASEDEFRSRYATAVRSPD